ncbi:EF_hand domain-containing protein [Hexamita inflata]|uniref:EF hand domain-containing protein n=1 Tax=Hexamita inflata TaxID=28002 RepID=A0AA86NDB1_9EUKA|nr:EF hand domain-containing protein [Hexamita inflata]CAI9944355.1 EF hand domain-containing protein [Hexamita inflata]CAI9945230.1 EF hand domain-containing protein [Hexamita inflata]CAI9964399.1 EF hand domain-containing protein [Hexamita inflata]CAI9973021.1 EF hand domain-containing protein [Hexamita inflata]
MQVDLNLYESIFRALDTDDSGGIDPDELYAALQELGIRMNKECIRSMIDLIDENGDGLMQLDEFCHFMYVCQNSKPNDTKSILFFAADNDYSGTIDKFELVEILEKLNVEITEDEVFEMAEQVADNEDGTLSYEMFLELMSKLMDEQEEEQEPEPEVVVRRTKEKKGKKSKAQPLKMKIETETVSFI